MEGKIDEEGKRLLSRRRGRREGQRKFLYVMKDTIGIWREYDRGENFMRCFARGAKSGKTIVVSLRLCYT